MSASIWNIFRQPRRTMSRDQVQKEQLVPTIIPTGSDFPNLHMQPVDAPHGWAQENGRRIWQVKLDGVGGQYIGGLLVAHSGAPLGCAGQALRALGDLQEAFGCAMVFDGEYVAEGGFNATIADFKAGSGDGVFWLYDAIPYDDWKAGRCPMPLRDRLHLLDRRFRQIDAGEFVGLVAGRELTALEGAAWLIDLWNNGAEGAVSKVATSPYVRERSDHWRRHKQVLRFDCTIMDVIARKDGTLQTMICRGQPGTQTAGMTIRVGTGWSRITGSEIVRLWQDVSMTECESLIVEIELQFTTGGKRSVRGAKFCRFRPDKVA